jgi:serine/threonine protein kinase
LSVSTTAGSAIIPFPMGPAPVHADVRRLFDAVVELPRDERLPWLAASCEGDQALYDDVADLLKSQDLFEQGFTLTPLVEAALRQPTSLDVFEGTRIGQYEVIREIGRGGMSTVYLAQRADRVYAKEVALKIVRPDGLHEDLLRRFQQERDIVAKLDHPHIARLLDGGTTDSGFAYSVMEHVEGQPLDVFCDARGLGIRDRIALLRNVCDAVEYAHRHLIVHRDLKPSNILVTSDGTVKLLDFGIAKLLDNATVETTTVDATATSRRFTFAYASPEQIRGESIATTTDVYSLGVVLYELLCGCRPHGTHASIPEIARAICEDEPVPPSRVVGRASGDGVELASSLRGTMPTRLARILSGELDNIVLTALRKEPGRRYASVERFNEDLGRYLTGLPVLAQPDTRQYRARKFVARYRTQVIAACLTAASLLAAVVGTTWEARTARFEGLLASRMAAEARDHALRAEQQTREAERYRLQAEEQTSLAQEHLRLEGERAQEAEKARRAAISAQQRAERRAQDVREISRELLTLSSAAIESPEVVEASRRGTSAVERGLTSLQRDGLRDPSIAGEVDAARQAGQRLSAAVPIVIPAGWTFLGDARDFECCRDGDPGRPGAVTRLASRGARIVSSAELVQNIDATNYRGRRVRVTAMLRSSWDDVNAALVARSYLPEGEAQAHGFIRAGNDWDKRSIVFDVPMNARTVTTGLRLTGGGAVWADDFSIEIVDQSIPLTVPDGPRPAPDLGFKVRP